MKEEQYKLLVSQIASLIDGERLATFDEIDRKYLEEICQRIRLSIR